MRRSCCLGSLALVACGRIGFDSIAGDAGVVVAATDANYAFVSTTQVAPGALGGLGGADAICNSDAANARLPGTYVAWLSTSTTNAVDRLAGARGWVRLDGKPIADQATDIAAWNAIEPIAFDALARPVAELVTTTSANDGTFVGDACDDLTQPVDSILALEGRSDATGALLSSADAHGCDLAMPLFCFGIDRVQPVGVPPPTAGKLLFVSSFWSPGGGVTDADAHCASDAQAAGATGAFLAWLSTSAQPASTRFSAASGPIVRPDGVVVARDVAALAAGTLDTAPNVTLARTYTSTSVWSGGVTPSLAGSASSSCQDWTSSAPSELGDTGLAELGDPGYFGDADILDDSTCNNGIVALYCLEQ